MSRLVKARVASLGLVAALGLLLIISLSVSAGISAFGNVLTASLPFGDALLFGLNELIALVLITGLFAAIYKVLPDRRLEWRDVFVGAIVTAVLFTIGKSLIGWYLGSSAVASSYGAAGALILALLWVYYSSLIFLFGAEFTRAYSISHGSHQHDAAKLSAEEPQEPVLFDNPAQRPRGFGPEHDGSIVLAFATVAAAISLASIFTSGVEIYHRMNSRKRR